MAKKFEDVAYEYEKTFGQQPPILTTLSTDDPLYLEQLEKADINNNTDDI